MNHAQPMLLQPSSFASSWLIFWLTGQASLKTSIQFLVSDTGKSGKADHYKVKPMGHSDLHHNLSQTLSFIWLLFTLPAPPLALLLFPWFNCVLKNTSIIRKTSLHSYNIFLLDTQKGFGNCFKASGERRCSTTAFPSSLSCLTLMFSLLDPLYLPSDNRKNIRNEDGI